MTLSSRDTGGPPRKVRGNLRSGVCRALHRKKDASCFDGLKFLSPGSVDDITPKSKTPLMKHTMMSGQAHLDYINKKQLN